MGTGAFERLWNEKPQGTTGAFDAAWGDEPQGSPLVRALRRHDPSAVAKIVGRQNQNEAEETAAASPTYRERLGGNLANLVRDVPGAEAMTTGVHAVLNRQPYRESLEDVRGTADQVPGAVKWPTRILGAIPAAAVMPGSAAMQGARYGVLSGALSADPNEESGDRLKRTMFEGAAGAVGGKVADVGITAGRGLFSKALGRNAVDRKAAMGAADATNYGRAAAEGASAPPQSFRSLRSETVKPFANVVRESESFKSADDPTVLQETYKLMSERQGKLGKMQASADDFRAGSRIEGADIGLAKQELLTDADAVMPSLRGAVREHATQAGEMDALGQGADAARRVVNRSKVAGKKLAKQSPEAFRETIPGMTQGQATAATEGVTGRLKESMGLSFNPLTGFGAGSSVLNANRVSPLLRELDEHTGRDGLIRALRAAGISLATP